MNDSIRVVVADDQQWSGRVWSLLGLLDGIEAVGAAANGAEAIELAQGNVDVVLMDLKMPVLDGVQATTRIGRLGGRRTRADDVRR